MTESLDKNKTDLTHRVTAIAAAYLASRGFKPIETEVSVHDGWIADLASFAYPTMTEKKNLKLIGGRKVVEPEYNEEKFLFRYGRIFTAIVEVKTSKGDYIKDKKFDSRIFPASLCYLAYPKGLIEKPPVGWFGLETDSEGNSLLRMTFDDDKDWLWRSGLIHAQHPGDMIDFMATVAIRCHHRTRYAANRAWLKAYRAGKTNL
jgi:hypothetical protein